MKNRALTPTVGEEEALTRDGPRSSRHASEEAPHLKHGEASHGEAEQIEDFHRMENGVRQDPCDISRDISRLVEQIEDLHRMKSRAQTRTKFWARPT